MNNCQLTAPLDKFCSLVTTVSALAGFLYMQMQVQPYISYYGFVFDLEILIHPFHKLKVPSIILVYI